MYSMRQEAKWDKRFEEQLINQTSGDYDDEEKTVLFELFFILRTEIFERDEDRLLSGEEYRVKAYLTVIEDFLVTEDIPKLNQIVSDMYEERDGDELLQKESSSQT